jgi:4-amino-4-deoxy-L-arabinose transferase-like glycosyltransferase
MSHTDLPTPPAEAPRLSLRPFEWTFVAIAGLACYVSFFSGMTVFGLVGPDEPRYAAIARAMAESGDWVTPKLYGEAWLEKPILYYWVAAAGYQLLGEGELAARLPSILGSLISMLATGWLGWRYFGRTTTLLFAVLYPSSIATLVFARAATTDTIFTSTLTLALAAALPVVIRPRGEAGRGFEVGWGGALGLAVLAKGPAGVLLAGSSSVIASVLVGRPERIWRLASPWAILTFCVVALPWYVLVGLANPEFVQVFLVSHNVERFLTPVFRHVQPFWFYGPVIILALAPWSAWIVGVAREGRAALETRARKGSASIFLACWVVFPIAFFSLSQSKLPGYVLPSVPPAILLLARGIAVTLEQRRAVRTLGIGTAGTLLAMSVAFLVAPGVESAGVAPGAVRPLGAIMGLAGLGALFFGARRQLLPVVATTALGVTLALWQLSLFLMPTLDPFISTRSVAEEASTLSSSAPVQSYGLHRTWQFGIEYYLRRPVAEWQTGGPAGTIVVTTTLGAREMQLEGTGVEIVREISNDAVLVRTTGADDRFTR